MLPTPISPAHNVTPEHNQSSGEERYFRKPEDACLYLAGGDLEEEQAVWL